MPNKPDLIRFLLKQRFPPLDSGARRRASNLISLAELQRRAAIDAYRSELVQKTTEELEALVAAAAAEAAEQAAKTEAGRLFNRFDAMATDALHEYWSKAAHWDTDEFVALALDRNPRQVNWKLIKPFIWISAFASKYSDLRELVLRATQARQLGLRNKPSRFLAWAARNEIAVPAKLDEAVRRHDPELTDRESLYLGALAERDGALRRVAQLESGTQVKGLRTRERETLLKLLVGMAVAAYKHDPTATRTSTAAAISQDLHTLGISIDEDTVRKWLKEAAEFLPPQTEHD